MSAREIKGELVDDGREPVEWTRIATRDLHRFLRVALAVVVAAVGCAFFAGRATAATPPPPMPRGTMSWYGTAPVEAGGPIACGTGRLNPDGFAVAMRRDSGVKCGQRVVICATTGRCVWARVLDRGPFVAGRDIDALPRVVEALGLDLDHGLYEITWRPVPTTATRGCYFPRWVGRPYWPRCTR